MYETDGYYGDHEAEARDFHYASDAEWDRAGAYEIGALHPELAWVSSDRDAWYPNPYYQGPPVPHPEEFDDECYIPDEEEVALRKADRLLNEPKYLDINDDIPF